MKIFDLHFEKYFKIISQNFFVSFMFSLQIFLNQNIYIFWTQFLFIFVYYFLLLFEVKRISRILKISPIFFIFIPRHYFLPCFPFKSSQLTVQQIRCEFTLRKNIFVPAFHILRRANSIFALSESEIAKKIIEKWESFQWMK